MPELGTHMASLNLFREADGRFYVTCAGMSRAALDATAGVTADERHEQLYRWIEEGVANCRANAGGTR